jgi:hypothetical protein
MHINYTCIFVRINTKSKNNTCSNTLKIDKICYYQGSSFVIGAIKLSSINILGFQQYHLI